MGISNNQRNDAAASIPVDESVREVPDFPGNFQAEPPPPPRTAIPRGNSIRSKLRRRTYQGHNGAQEAQDERRAPPPEPEAASRVPHVASMRFAAARRNP